MTDAQLIRFVGSFRRGLLGKRSSVGMCAMMCWPLVTLLNMHGIKCRTITSELDFMNHIWIELADGRALDPTLDQFNILCAEKFPKIYLGPPTKYHAQ